MDQLRSLRVFAQVIAKGSFAETARALDLAPSVVTRAVSDLEAHLGVRLLNRTTRSIALTEIGEDYLVRAKRILEELDDATALARSANSEPSGNLRILCPPAFAIHQLVKHLTDFHHRFPGIQLELSASGPVVSADENFDVSILSIGQQPLQGDFVIRQLASSSFVICAAPTYLQRFGRPQNPTDLLSHEGLLPQVAAVKHELTLIHTGAGTSEPEHQTLNLKLRPPLLSTSQLEILYAAALAGMGVTGLPTFMVVDALRDGRLERVLPEWRGGTLQLYTAIPTRKHVPVRTRVFLDFLIEIFGGKKEDPWLATLG